jgi:ABC-type branched-subunit amino acid transport system ATPase component
VARLLVLPVHLLLLDEPTNHLSPGWNGPSPTTRAR